MRCKQTQLLSGPARLGLVIGPLANQAGYALLGWKKKIHHNKKENNNKNLLQTCFKEYNGQFRLNI